MREPIIQTAINKFLTWLAKKSVTALYKQTHFWTYSWGLDENTDLYLISEESYLDRHRFGVHEEKYADTPQTTLCRECGDYAGDGMYCASNYLVYDFSTSRENCEKERSK